MALNTRTRALLIIIALGCAPPVAESGISIEGYGGTASTARSDVRLERPAGTDLTFADVGWRADSFQSPIYYGLRGTYWLESTDSRWGIFVDFIHAKMYAQLEETVRVSGSRDGAPVDGQEPMSDTFSSLAFSHGHNLLLAGVAYAWRQPAAAGGLLDRTSPRAGFGIGLGTPHVEVEIDGDITDEYQIDFGLEAYGGATVAVVAGLAALVEAKVTYARLDASLQGGGSLHVRPWTGHFVFGAAYTWH